MNKKTLDRINKLAQKVAEIHTEATAGLNSHAVTDALEDTIEEMWDIISEIENDESSPF